jgi:hypothetical protein
MMRLLRNLHAASAGCGCGQTWLESKASEDQRDHLYDRDDRGRSGTERVLTADSLAAVLDG